jgi:hypothetical protein
LIAAGDVAAAVVEALFRDDLACQTIEIGGAAS